MKKIKILHFVSGLISGGVEQMLYNYCKFMDHEKYEFVIVYQHVPVLTCIEKMESIGCKTIRITARSENLIKNIKDSIDVIQSEKPDIVHAHMNLMNFCALYAAKKCGVKVRISHSHIAEKNKGIMFNMMANVFKQMCIKYATAYFACGEEAGLYMYGKKKMEAGAAFFMTQPVFSDEDIKRLSTIKKETGARILCGIMPLVSLKNATFMKNEMAGIDVTDEVLSRYSEDMTKKEGEVAGVKLAVDMINKTKDIVDGYYFSFPFNRVYMLEDILSMSQI